MPETGSRTRQFFTIVAITLIMLAAFGEIYAYSIKRLQTSPWIAVLAAHIALSLVLYVIRKPVRVALRITGGSWIPWSFAPLIILGSLILAFTTPREASTIAIPGASNFAYSLATVTLIPFFEEIVFRAGVSPFLGRFANGWWSAWFSAIVFSVAHTFPTWTRIITLEVGLPLGPFILGLCCEFIFKKWGKLGPAIAFHAACNGTIFIFSSLNPSWLKHLSGLYM